MQEENELSARLAELVGKEKALRTQIHTDTLYSEGVYMCGVYIRTCVCTCVHVCVHVCTYIHAYVYMCVYMCACMYVYVIIISERASSVIVHVNRDLRYVYIYMWPYVNLYAHALESIAKKRP